MEYILPNNLLFLFMILECSVVWHVDTTGTLAPGLTNIRNKCALSDNSI